MRADVDIRGEPPEHRGVLRRPTHALTALPPLLGVSSCLSRLRGRAGVRGSLLILPVSMVVTWSGRAAASPPAELAAPPPSAATAAPATSTAPATPPSARTPSGAKLGVLGIGPATLPANLAAALESAAAAGLAASGGEVVARALTARPPGSCDTAACLRGVSGASGARYLLRGTCQIEASNYRVRLELVDGVSGTVAAAREDTCEICTEHDVVEAANIAASALKVDFDRTAERTAKASTPAPAARGADLSKTDAAGGRGSGAPRPTWLRVAPWVAFAAAAGAIGAGAYYLWLNDLGTDYDRMAMMYTRFNDTRWEGGALIGAGVVAAALGVLALTWTPSSGGAAAPARGASTRAPSPAQPTGVSLSPAGFAAWTRF